MQPESHTYRAVENYLEDTMQTVAKFQFVSATINSGSPTQIADVIEKWGANKFEQDNSGKTAIRRSGIPAIFNLPARNYRIIHPNNIQRSRTSARWTIKDRGQEFLDVSGTVHFQCALALGSRAACCLQMLNSFAEVHSGNHKSGQRMACSRGRGTNSLHNASMWKPILLDVPTANRRTATSSTNYCHFRIAG